MLKWSLGVKDVGVGRMLRRAYFALEAATEETADELGTILSDEVKHYTPVLSGSLKAAFGKYTPQHLRDGADADLAERSAIFNVYKTRNGYGVEVGTRMPYAKDINYGYTVEENRVIRLIVGGHEEFRTLVAGTRYPGRYMLEKGMDATRLRLIPTLRGNVRKRLTAVQREGIAGRARSRPRVSSRTVASGRLGNG